MNQKKKEIIGVANLLSRQEEWVEESQRTVDLKKQEEKETVTGRLAELGCGKASSSILTVAIFSNK